MDIEKRKELAGSTSLIRMEMAKKLLIRYIRRPSLVKHFLAGAGCRLPCAP